MAIFLVVSLSGCGAGGSNSSGQAKAGTSGGGPAGAGGNKKERLYPVRTQPVQMRPLQYVIRAVGSVQAQDVFRVDARLPGTLYDVNFNVGDRVTSEQVLCRIAPEAYRQAALKAEAEQRHAVADLANARRKFANAVEMAKVKLKESEVEIARRRSIQNVGAISDEEVELFQSRRDMAALQLKDEKEAAETEVKVLEAKIAEKDAALKIAQEDVQKSIVRPPIGGIIEERMVTQNMFVTAGTKLATIVDLRALKLHFKVAERDSAVVKKGTKVSFTVPAHAGKQFEAEVYHVANQMDAMARVVECWAWVTRDAEKLKPGYFASVTIVTSEEQRKAVVVPAVAVLPSERGFIAFVVKDGKAEQRAVTLGLTVTDNSVEVLDGLQVGDELVVDGGNSLQPGVSVKVLNAQPAPEAKAPAAVSLQ